MGEKPGFFPKGRTSQLQEKAGFFSPLVFLSCTQRIHQTFGLDLQMIERCGGITLIMKYYPVNLDIQNRRCLVVGGGNVGARKVMTLLECGAMITVVSPIATERLIRLANKKSITWKERHYQSADLTGMFLVIGATDNEELNWRIHADAERQGKLCNIADRPQACNFILPSVVNRGDLILAISTSGASPAFAKKLRQDLEKEFGEEYAEFLRLMRAVRKKLLLRDHAPEAHKPIFEKLISKGMLDLIREKNTEEMDHLLRKVVGKEYDFESLMESVNVRRET